MFPDRLLVISLAIFSLLCWREAALQVPWAIVASAAIFGQIAAALYGSSSE